MSFFIIHFKTFLSIRVYYVNNNNKGTFNYFIFFIDLMMLFLMTRHLVGPAEYSFFFFSILAWVIFTYRNPHISLITLDVTTVTYVRWPFDLLYLFTDVPPPTHTCSHSRLHTPPHSHPSPLPSPHARAPRVFSYMCQSAGLFSSIFIVIIWNCISTGFSTHY